MGKIFFGVVNTAHAKWSCAEMMNRCELIIVNDKLIIRFSIDYLHYWIRC